MTAQERQAFLNVRRLPARLDISQAAALLNFGEHDLSRLVSSGLLKPLGRPAPNAPKYFASVQIVELASSPEWLDRATRAITTYWKTRNNARCESSG